MKKLKIYENADKEFKRFLETKPRFVEMIGKAVDVGGRLHVDLANVISTLAYVSKTKGTLKEQVAAYEVLTERLLNLAVDLRAHGKYVTDQLMFLVDSADYLLEAFKDSDEDSFQEFLCEIKPTKGGSKHDH